MTARSANSLPLPAAGTDPGLDYSALLAEGTGLVQRLSGDIWTNYNWSDPGVTILQQVCYALTELSYRSDFPVADLLGAPHTGRVALRRQALYPARAIMPVNPVTINDLRRLIIDRVPAVGNAWFAKAPVSGASDVSGLYRITVLVPALDPGCEDHGPHPDAVRREVRDCYAAHRALCEDVDDVVVLRPIRARVRADVQLDDHVDPDTVLAEILFQAGLALAPEPRRTSLDQRRAAGLSTTEIFTGPVMLRGFIDDDQLTPMPARVPVDYLKEIVAEVPGVLSVNRLSVEVLDRTYRPGDTIDVPAGHILWLETEPGAEGHALRLMHGTSHCRTNPVKVRRKLTRDWADQRRIYDLWSQYADAYRPPSGTVTDLAAYSSIQNQFPDVYGIGAYGLPPGAGAARKGQTKQLKGYLMVFDQLMADFFAQLAFVRDLFSLSAGGDKTYVGQSLAPIVPDVKPLLEPGYETGLQALIAASDPVVARQNGVLDFLLSLYAETLAPPADAACGGVETAPGIALVEAKKALLGKLVPATRDRGRGVDYHRPRDHGIGSGLEIRCRIDLALLDATSRRDGATVVTGADASFGWRLPPELGAVVSQTFLPVDVARHSPDRDAADAASPLAGHTVDAALMPALADPARYSVGALPGSGPVFLVCRDLDEACWVLGEFPDVSAAVAMTDRLVHAAGGMERRLYIVEWTLLRFAQEHHHHHHHHHGDPDGAPKDYSFRISAVMPAGDGEADSGWRHQARRVVRSNMPSHIVVEDMFLHHRRLRHFRHLYHAWMDALREGSRERRAKTSWHLERFLQRGMSPATAPAPPAPASPT